MKMTAGPTMLRIATAQSIQNGCGRNIRKISGTRAVRRMVPPRDVKGQDIKRRSRFGKGQDIDDCQLQGGFKIVKNGGHVHLKFWSGD